MAKTSQNIEGRATLGCGTLILIALIVLIFGNLGRGELDELRNHVQNATSQITMLKGTVDKQTQEIRRLSGAIEDLRHQLGSTPAKK